MKNYIPSKKTIHSFFHFLLFSLLVASLTSCGSGRIIVNQLDEKEANEILVFLASKNIEATKVQVSSEGGGSKQILWNISVPSENATEAMALLNQAGLPRRRGQNLLGIFSNVGLVPSGMEQKVRYQAGLAEQIANTIRKIEGVLDADVQLSFPEEDPLNPTANKQKITASVFITHSGVLDDPNAHLATRVKRLVSGSINGLDYDNVTVIGDRARAMEATGLNTGENAQRPMVNVWFMTIAAESLTRFRIIFFSFIITLILLTLALAWLCWKCIHVFKKVGFKSLFNYHSIQLENLVPKEAPKPDELPEKQPEKEKIVDQGVDET
jgi:type III secretion protein J